MESDLATKALTHKQQAVLEFIQQYVGKHQRSPLIREIQFGCQIVSYKSAVDRLNALEHKGWLTRFPNKHRGIRLIRKPLQASVPGPDRAPSLQVS